MFAANCPICGKPTNHETKPFCSKRCADVDLARWFRGGYAVPTSESEEIPDDGDEPTQH